MIDHGTVNEENAVHDAQPLEGAVLLSEASWDKAAFIEGIKTEWSVAIDPEDAGTDLAAPLVFECDGSVLIIQLVHETLDAAAAAAHAAMNPKWKEAGVIAKLHRAFAAAVAIPKTASTLENARTLVKVLSVLCADANALAVDTGSAILSPDDYRAGADVIRSGEYPIYNLVTFAVVRSEPETTLGCTMGLTMLGLNEIEILPSNAEPKIVSEFLFTVAQWMIKGEHNVEEGTLLGLNPSSRHPVRLAPSNLIPGMDTLQITL